MALTAAMAKGKRQRRQDPEQELPPSKRARVPAPEDLNDSDFDEPENEDQEELDDAGSDLDSDDVDAGGTSSDEYDSGGAHSDDEIQGNDDLDDEHGEDGGDEEEEEQRQAVRSISFGALANAQNELEDTENTTRSRQKGASDRDQKLQALRDRLAELRANKSAKKSTPRQDISSKPKTKDKRRRRRTESDSDSDEPEEEPRRHHRSKHAPAEQSSKYQVSRRRQVVDTAGHLPPSAAHGGDPRFSAATGPLDRARVARNYAFLDDYAARELAALKKQLAEGMRARARKKGPRAPPLDAAAAAALRVEIGRRENRAAAGARRAREDEVRRAHNRRERERVAAGKKPFFLRKGAAREIVERESWEGLKDGERAKREERRTKKAEQKGLKMRPGERRSFVRDG